MPATSKATFINERHSFVSGQYTEKRDAPKRIPRPPNAFILYRSDFLKRRAVPPEVEKHQQNLSRIAGQCWNMLPETEKAIWYGKAAVVRAEHRARYPSDETRPFHKDTSRLLTKSNQKRRGSVTNSGPSFCRSRTCRTCESMFAVLDDSEISSPASQASLLPRTPASASPSSATSPLLLRHVLPQITSLTHSSWQDLPPATSESSTICRDKISCLPDSSGSDAQLWGLSQDSDIMSNGIGSPQKLRPTLQQYEPSFATCIPCSSLKQIPELRSDPVARLPLTQPGPNTFHPERYHLADSPSLANSFDVTNNLTHFDQPLIPLYPWYSDKLNTAFT